MFMLPLESTFTFKNATNFVLWVQTYIYMFFIVFQFISSTFHVFVPLHTRYEFWNKVAPLIYEISYYLVYLIFPIIAILFQLILMCWPGISFYGNIYFVTNFVYATTLGSGLISWRLLIRPRLKHMKWHKSILS